MNGMTPRSLRELSNPRAQKFDSVARTVEPALGLTGGRVSFDRTVASARSVRHALARVSASMRRMLGRALPQTCVLCTAWSGDALLCPPCMNALPSLSPACPACAGPSPASTLCGACLKRPPKFTTTIAACSYAYPLDRLVQALKYEHRLAIAEPLGDKLAAAVRRSAASAPLPDALVALPLSATRQRERGFNQAIEIARVVGRRIGVPLASGLVRTGNAPAQATLPWAERRRNVRGAFACTASFAGRHVAIVDDVMTTGATLEAAAGALLTCGAARVDAWVVARTPPPSA